MNLLLLIYPLLVYSQIEVEIGKTYEGFIAPWRNQLPYDVYKIKVDQKKESQDLVLLVKALSPMGDPNIYVSIVNELPITPELADIAKCESKGIDICIIDSEHIYDNTVFNTVITCSGHCRYSFKVMYEGEMKMSAVDILEFQMDEKEETKIVTIYAGEISKSDVEMEINVRVKNYLQLEESFHTYLNYGDSFPSAEMHDQIGRDTYSGSQIFKISGSQLLSGQFYRLLIQAPPGAIIELRTKKYGIVRDFHLYEDVEDIIEVGQYSLFKLDLEAGGYRMNGDSLNIQLRPYTGYAKLYVHADYQPTLLDQYQWSFIDFIGEDLVITQKELDELNMKGNVFYIAVLGMAQQTTFAIWTQLVNNNYMILENDKPTHGRLASDEIISYLFIIEGEKPQSITIHLTNYLGNSDLIVKKCGTLQCKVEQSDIMDRKTIQGEFYYSETDGDDLIVLKTDPSQCEKYKTKTVCYYVLGIYARESDLKEFSYSIIVSTQEGHTLLKENTPHKHFVSQGLYTYFKFIVPENDEIHRLAFIVTPIQGTPEIYVSKTNHRPTKESYEQVGNQNVVAFGGRNGNTPSAGTYYISVFGQSSSLFTINPTVIRNWGEMRVEGKFDWHYHQIYPGDPHLFKPQKEEITLLKLDLAQYGQSESQKLPITVIINQEMGEFELFGFDHPEADNSKFNWTGNKQINIKPTDPNYPQQLYIKVVPKGDLQNYQFQIAITIGSQPTELVLGHNYYGFLEKDQIQLFSVVYLTGDNLVLTKNPEALDKSKLVVSVDLKNNNIISLTEKQSIIIDGSLLPIQDCSQTEQPEYICQINIQVIAKESMFYSLLITHQSQNLNLIDAVPLTRPIPIDEDHYNFLMSSAKPVEIMVTSLSGELKILIDVVQGESSIYQYPTETTAKKSSLSSKYNLASSVQIGPEMLEFCKLDCVILITIKKAFPEKSTYFGEYTIVQSSFVMLIQEGLQYTVTIEQNAMKYFKINLFDETKGLMIVATPLTVGDPDIFVAKERLPSVDDYDWSSRHFLGDQLIIEANNSIANMTGIFYIGIYGFQEVTCTLQVRTGDMHLYSLYKGTPFNLMLQRGGVAYFDYIHYDDKLFTVLTSGSRGLSKIYMQTYNLENEIEKWLNTDINSFQYNGGDGLGYSEIVQVNRTRNFCFGCHYLIAIQATTDVDLTVTIMVENEYVYLSNNVEQLNYIQKGSEHHYHYFTTKPFNVTITAYYGVVTFYGAFKQNIDTLNENDLNFAVNSSLGENKKPFSFTTQVNLTRSEETPYYTLKIRGDEDARYTILCVNEKTVQELKLGQPVEISLSFGTNGYFTFRSDNSIPNARFSLTVETYGQSVENRKQKQQHPYVEVNKDMNYRTLQYDTHYMRRILAVDEVNTETIHYLEYDDIPGLYYVEIHPKTSSILPYTITLGNSELNTLVPTRERMVYSTVGHTQKWEVYLRQPSQIFMTLQMCGGIVNLFGSQSKEKIEHGQYDEAITVVHNKQIAGAMQVKKEGLFYIGSTLVRTHPQGLKKASYTIRTDILQIDTYIPQEEFAPGLGGEIFWEIKQNDDQLLSVEVKSIEKKVSDKYKIDVIVYYLVYEFKDLDDESPLNQCALGVQYQQYDEKPDSKKNSINLSQNFTTEQLANKKMLFNVHARVHLFTNNYEKLALDYYYQPEILRGEHIRNSKLKYYMKYFTLGIFIGGIIWIIVLLKRNRSLQKQLKYEITDVRNKSLVNPNNVESAIEMNYRGFADQQ